MNEFRMQVSVYCCHHCTQNSDNTIKKFPCTQIITGGHNTPKVCSVSKYGSDDCKWILVNEAFIPYSIFEKVEDLRGLMNLITAVNWSTIKYDC